MTKVTRRNFIRALLLSIGASPAIVTSVVALEAVDAVVDTTVSQTTTGAFSSFYGDLEDLEFNNDGPIYRTSNWSDDKPVWHLVDLD